MPMAMLFSATFIFPLTSLAAGGHILGGPTNAPVRIEVFSDFECPGCRQLYLETLRKVVEVYSTKGKVCVVYHEFPLSSHKYSREAAKYASAAAQMGPSTLMKVMDGLFKKQAYWSQDGIIEPVIAQSLPPDQFAKLKGIMKSSAAAINAGIERDVLLGTQLGVNRTPTFFSYYNGKQQKTDSVVIYPVFKDFLDKILK
jgi:protein-disulfide isomerase